VKLNVFAITGKVSKEAVKIREAEISKEGIQMLNDARIDFRFFIKPFLLYVFLVKIKN